MGKRISTFVPRGGDARKGKEQGPRSKDVYGTALPFLPAGCPNRKLEWPFQGTRIIVFCVCLCFFVFHFHQQSAHLATLFSGLSIARLRCWPT